MRFIKPPFVLLTIIVLWGTLAQSEPPQNEAPWLPLFNGKDLTGWQPVNVAPGTFTARDGMIVSTGKPTGVLRTDRMYENCIVELEWRHMKPGGNAGFFFWGDGIPSVGIPFTRGIEVQILDNAYNAKGKNEWFTTVRKKLIRATITVFN